jgi:Ca-activated chloride channel family protein
VFDPKNTGGAVAKNRSRIPLAIAVVVGLVLIFGVRWLLGGDDEGSVSAEEDLGNQVDGDCIVLTVAASSEKAALLRDMSDEYDGTGPDVDGRCVDVQVSAKASGAAAAALARGWDDEVDGPRPDVWSPAASGWTVLLQQGLTDRDAPNMVPAELASVARTPLVVAMPRPMAEALGWPDTEIGWSDLIDLSQDPSGWGSVGHPEWGKFKLGKTNPEVSTSGLNATVAAYFAATGLSSDLSEDDLADPAVQEFIRRLEQSVVHYGDTTLTFLSNLQRADAEGQGLTYVSAVTVEEKSVWDYNQGNPSGDPRTLDEAEAPQIPLVAIYPREGTLFSDNPYVVLEAEWVDEAKRAAAADFLRYVQEPDQQQRFQQAAFRTFEGEPGELITPTNGMLPDQPATELGSPAPAVLRAIQESWDTLRKPARVLLIIDVSGSMGQAVEGTGRSRLELAKEAAVAALDGFAGRDEVGLWMFSTGLGSNGEPWVERVPVGAVTETLEPIRRDVQAAVADGGTGLYATLREAQATMVENLDTTRINAIVLLSDGQNEYPADTDLDSLLDQLEAESLDTSIRVFPIAYSEQADLEALTAVAEASRAAVYDASDPAAIGNIMTNVISNF